MLTSLRPAGDAFKEMLHDVEAMLNRCKVNMKRDLETNISSYNERCVVCIYQCIAKYCAYRNLGSVATQCYSSVAMQNNAVFMSAIEYKPHKR
jgi:hypothetical protein